jgi:selenide, water dikinase
MEVTDEIKLTAYSRGAGCGCKIAPQLLQEMLLSSSTPVVNPNLLVGNESSDDAAVYDLGNGTALISTTDFFMPIVDDAYDFGRIAAANAISDVYAMGGKPLLALAILGWPVDKLPASLAQQVLEGSRAICKEAGITLAGGHTIDSTEPMFGLAVTGIVSTDNLKKNNTAKEGDLIFLTKPIGVGILSTAQKRGAINHSDAELMVQQMTTLNSVGEVFGKFDGITSMTDVTGFGLLGHLIEMAEGSGLSAEISYGKIPVLAEAREYLSQRIVPDATYRNWNSYGTKVSFEKGINVMEAFNLLPDPQTNGGLLIACRSQKKDELLEILHSEKIAVVEPIGHFVIKQEKTIFVKQ